MKRPRIKHLFQFSLRTMLVVMVATGVALGVLGTMNRRAHRQKAVVAWVEEIGGSVVYDRMKRGPEPEPPNPIWLCERIGVDYFATVISVRLAEKRVTDLSRLANLPKLKWLWLSGVPVTDLTPLAKLTSLQVLSLGNTLVSDEEIAKLQKALPKCRIKHRRAG